jgi:hypothetical protein
LVIPVEYRLAHDVGLHLVRLVGVVEHQDIAAFAGNRSAD